jgi:hypothetical protein
MDPPSHSYGVTDANLEAGSRTPEGRDEQKLGAHVGRAISPLSAASGNARLARECEPYQKTRPTEVDLDEQSAKTRILILDNPSAARLRD